MTKWVSEWVSVRSLKQEIELATEHVTSVSTHSGSDKEWAEPRWTPSRPSPVRRTCARSTANGSFLPQRCRFKLFFVFALLDRIHHVPIQVAWSQALNLPGFTTSCNSILDCVLPALWLWETRLESQVEERMATSARKICHVTRTYLGQLSFFTCN